MARKTALWAAQVDRETDTALELMRANLERQLGHAVNRSQLLRWLITRQVANGAVNAELLGWKEGYQAGYARFQEVLQTAVYQAQSAAVREIEDLPATHQAHPLHGAG